MPDELNFPELPPGFNPEIVAPVVEFDPSFIFQGIDQARALTEQGIGDARELTDRAIDFATEQFGIASGFQHPFFNQAAGFGQLSGRTLQGSFDPRRDANAFVAGPGNPEFDFRLQQGVNAIDSAAAASGQLNAGSRLQDLQALGQGLSSTFSTEDLARRQAIADQNFRNLSGLAGFEQAASNNLSNISTGLGQIGANSFNNLGANILSARSGLGSNILGALSGAAGLQNQTALANAGFDITAQTGNINNVLGLLEIANRPGGSSGTSTTGQIGGIALSLLPYLLG